MPEGPAGFTLRLASSSDLASINKLITQSLTHFCEKDYTPSQVAAISHQATSGRYDSLIKQSTYYVVSPTSAPDDIVACGGWTPHRTIYSIDSSSETAIGESFDPGLDPAWIRGVYCHPHWAGRGLGRWIMRVCEEAACRDGFCKFELASTVNAVGMYEACGYVGVSEKVVGLPQGQRMKVVMMRKERKEEN